MPQDPVLTLAKLHRYMDGAFLGQFAPRLIEVKISTGGMLGTMAYVWRRVGAENWSPPIPSSSVAPWLDVPDKTWAELTFAAGTYVLDTTYRVEVNGTVVPGAGAFAGLSAVRFDKRLIYIDSVTEDAITAMAPEVVPPIVTWGPSAEQHAAAWVKYLLKSDVGMAPPEMAVGDGNVVAQEGKAEEFFTRIGKGHGRPPGLVDSSAPDPVGDLLAYPDSDETVGY